MNEHQNVNKVYKTHQRITRQCFMISTQQTVSDYIITVDIQSKVIFDYVVRINVRY